ncbi:MAG TPA: CPBP family intramembrane glutamic endopeptidase [Pseudolabrys sp.]|nr:CPBP family intramembrane glutamic endopeptidase [Pseudolabrys sp.]
MTPWGRLATFGLAVIALMAGQLSALLVLTLVYGPPGGQTELAGDGVAITLIIAVSTPVEVALLVQFARRTGAGAAEYLGWVWPRRGQVVFGVLALAGFIVVSNLVSTLFGRSVVTDFQIEIYRTARAQGMLPLLWLAVAVLTPIGEETLFRGFLFRGFLRAPRDAWPTIVATSLLFALIHVQYDWFVIGQVFVAGLLLGWMRWATGSTVLTMLLHGLINIEGMLETALLHG